MQATSFIKTPQGIGKPIAASGTEYGIDHLYCTEEACLTEDDARSRGATVLYSKGVRGAGCGVRIV